MIEYCKKCILPNTRPNLKILDNGICNACHSHELKKDVDWAFRQKMWLDLIKKIKSKNRSWDCIIPVSGGKDSTWQVITCLEYGLKPLCVTWKTPHRSKLGQQNLDNLISLGVDHFDVSINPEIEKIFTLKAFKEKGSTAIPMHMALFSIPLNLAVKFDVPLILWGENSAVEYGGGTPDQISKMNRNWLMNYGVTNNTLVKDWVDNELTTKDLSIYTWPSDLELEDKNIEVDFLGNYFEWDPVKTFEISKKFGFKELDKPLVGYYNFADIDDAFLITLHHWMKWYKFGFTRLWDNLSLEIRKQRLTRELALDIIKSQTCLTPIKEIKNFSHWVGITSKDFFKIAENFRNNEIWEQVDNIWQIKNFIIHNWNWKNEP